MSVYGTVEKRTIFSLCISTWVVAWGLFRFLINCWEKRQKDFLVEERLEVGLPITPFIAWERLLARCCFHDGEKVPPKAGPSGYRQIPRDTGGGLNAGL